MPQIRKSVLVPYSTQRMFELVAAVPDYPQFMPWCGGAWQAPEPDGSVRATIEIDFKGIRSSFTTFNQNDAPRAITLRFVDGPFADLSGQWRFNALAIDACKVEFDLDYEFAGTVLGRLIAPVFDAIANSFIDAFARRAEALYG